VEALVYLDAPDKLVLLCNIWAKTLSRICHFANIYSVWVFTSFAQICLSLNM